jgi:hypothetical protein
VTTRSIREPLDGFVECWLPGGHQNAVGLSIASHYVGRWVHRLHCPHRFPSPLGQMEVPDWVLGISSIWGPLLLPSLDSEGVRLLVPGVEGVPLLVYLLPLECLQTPHLGLI